MNILKCFYVTILLLLMNWIVIGCSAGSEKENSQVPLDTTTNPTSEQATTGKTEKIKSPQNGEAKPPEKMTEISIADSVNPFAIDLYKQLSKQQGNIFLSPYSIYSALTMVYYGAKQKTREQMTKFLHFDEIVYNQLADFQDLVGDRNEFYQFYQTNSLWMQKDFPTQPDFIYFLEDKYNGFRIQQQDFAHESESARQAINQFVERQTLGKIKELLNSGILSEQTKLVLVNAIYFRGAWKFPFDEAQTKNEAFYITPKKQTMVPTMSQEYSVNYLENELIQLIELPYKGKIEEQGDFSMVILLPKNTTDFQKIEQNLKDWVIPKGLKKQLVAIHLPKFTAESNVDLVNTLKSLGVVDAFSQKDADFSGIGQNIFLSAVAHKAFVEVNEQGTEATASTAVVTTSRGVIPKAKEFRANRPFIFWIKDNFFGTILFLGRVTEPKV